MILFLVLALLPSLTSLDTIDPLIQKGDEAYTDFRTQDAISHYAEAYRKDPRSYETLTRLARAWSDLGRLSLRRSDSSEAYYRKGLEYAEELVDAHPDSATSWFMLALCHGSLTPFKSLGEKLDIAKDVEKNAKRSLSIDSTYSMTYVLLGIYYRGVSRLSWVERAIVNGILGSEIEGTLEDSYANLQRALEYDPLNSYAYFELSNTLRSMEREHEALEALKRVISIPPTNERERQQLESAQRRLDRSTSAPGSRTN